MVRWCRGTLVPGWKRKNTMMVPRWEERWCQEEKKQCYDGDEVKRDGGFGLKKNMYCGGAGTIIV